MGGGAGCRSCGAKLKTGALYCAECGVAVAPPEAKSASARLPWILSALSLAAFSVVIALLVQRGTVPRTGDMTMTGGFSDPNAGAPAAGGTMPSMEELAAMSPREAADRLFDRAMAEHQGGDMEATAFFIDMGLQAYDAVPLEETDSDLHFHIGYLRLLAGDAEAAQQRADAILTDDDEHLLGLILQSQIAQFSGATGDAEELRDRVRNLVADAGGIPDVREYQAHRPLIESVLRDTP